MPRSRCILVLAVAAALLVPPSAWAAKRAPVTSAGWKVTPTGRQVGVSGARPGFQGPLASALSPGGSKLLAVSSGASRMNSTDLFEIRRRPRRLSYRRYDARRGVGRAVFYGIAWSPDGRRAWASGGGQDVVHAYSVGDRIREVGQIPAPHFPAGLAYGRTPLGDRIYVANNLGARAGATNPPGRTVTVIDPATNAVTAIIDLGVALQPYGVAFERLGRKAYVTQWMGRSVTVIDTARQVAVKQVALSRPRDVLKADHPNAVAANPRRDEVYTANGNSDTVSVIDTRRDRVAATVDVSLARGAMKGATPDGLAVSPNGRRLYVALAGENAVAAVDVARRRTVGFIPTAWYPTDVDVTPNGRRLVVTAANRAGLRPNRCAGPYAKGDCSSGDLIYSDVAPVATEKIPKGVLNVIRVPRTRKGLRRQTARVRRNNRVGARRQRMPRRLARIRHVIYVIKENRTYDQVLGDLRRGNGDRSLALFREDSAPNHRELARRFTLFDNFFADAEVSADGHSWSVGAGVTDYTNRTWPVTYSPGRRRAHRARDFENVSPIERFATEPLPWDTSILRPAAALTRGYLWDNAYHHGVSFRDYGEFTRIPGDCTGATNTSETTTLDDRRFGDHVDERFAGFNLACSDHVHRQPEWEREFRAHEARYAANPRRDPLPRLQIVRLPNDHTWGTVPGRATPEAYMADNDLALGRLVEAVSHSRFWRSTAIFVTEDDAQNGPDHVDAHRTLAYIISPYTQRRRTDHTHYHTAGMVATIEDLLGLPPMTIADQRAIRMWKGFARRPNFKPYTARVPRVKPFGAAGAPVNARAAPLARAAAGWDFSIEDATPEIPLNEAIWRSIRGRRSRMPAPRHHYIVGTRSVDAGGG